MKYYYPAIFTPMENDAKGHVLIMPDVKGCVTQGYTLEEAFENAHDALGTMLEDVAQADYPTPSNVNDIDLSQYPKGSFVSLVCFDKERWDADLNPVNAARENAGLTIKGLSEILKAPYRTVQNWCDGTRTPPPWAQRLILNEIERATKKRFNTAFIR